VVLILSLELVNSKHFRYGRGGGDCGRSGRGHGHHGRRGDGHGRDGRGHGGRDICDGDVVL